MKPEQVVDHLLILQRYAAYAHAVDAHDGDAYADCYTPDGWTDVSSFKTVKALAAAGLMDFMDRKGIIRGRENLRKSAGLVNLHHLIGNVLIRSIDGDRARGSAYFVVFAPDNGHVEHYGRYEDELARCPDGQWRLVSRVDIAKFERDRPPPLASRSPLLTS